LKFIIINTLTLFLSLIPGYFWYMHRKNSELKENKPANFIRIFISIFIIVIAFNGLKLFLEKFQTNSPDNFSEYKFIRHLLSENIDGFLVNHIISESIELHDDHSVKINSGPTVYFYTSDREKCFLSFNSLDQFILQKGNHLIYLNFVSPLGEVVESKYLIANIKDDGDTLVTVNDWHVKAKGFGWYEYQVVINNIKIGSFWYKFELKS